MTLAPGRKPQWETSTTSRRAYLCGVTSTTRAVSAGRTNSRAEGQLKYFDDLFDVSYRNMEEYAMNRKEFEDV